MREIERKKNVLLNFIECHFGFLPEHYIFIIIIIEDKVNGILNSNSI